MEELSQYHMIVKHRAGARHGIADAFSRVPDALTPCPSYISGITPDRLPCGGCSYCERADRQWGEFTREVDDAVGLSMRMQADSSDIQGGTTGSSVSCGKPDADKVATVVQDSVKPIRT